MIDRTKLLAKLGPVARKTLDAALGLTLSRTNYDLEIEHWLHTQLADTTGDVPAIVRHFRLDKDRLEAQIKAALDDLKRGQTRRPSLSPDIPVLINEAWSLASVNYDEMRVRTGHLLLAALSHDRLAPKLTANVPELKKIPAEKLKEDFVSITESTEEAGQAMKASAQPSTTGAVPATAEAPDAKPGGALDQFTTDLTAAAKSGKIDSIVGRDSEIRQMIDILCRRRQNNPILVGEAGVGKTAIAEGFAVRIAKGDVPAMLKDVALRSLDLGLLQAGAGVRGEFENRLKGVIQEVQASPRPVIMFIDEAHTLIGAGGSEGTNDAANLLKPALARGELRSIAATTWPEYSKYFEKDAALSRRFQLVRVEEPDETSAINMMRCMVGMLEKHHKVRILGEAVEDSVRLSARYIPARQLPDKSVSVLDTACARVQVSRAATPATIEDLGREIEALDVEIGLRSRDLAGGVGTAEDIAQLEARKEAAGKELETVAARYEQEMALANQLDTLRAELEAIDAADNAADRAEERAAKVSALQATRAQLKDMQGEDPLVHEVVDGAAVAEVIGEWTGIPVGKMKGDEISGILDLENRMGERIIGQRHAINRICEVVRNARAKLHDPKKPMGVFLLVGTSGVGKTETALAVADLLYGGEQNLITLNMSEYHDETGTNALLGAKPGYVGYEEGGILTEAVRRNPYSVVLLDEIEKADKALHNALYQIFDKGTARDGTGRVIDFKNCVIMMTSNAGTDTIHKLCRDPETMPTPEALNDALKEDLLSEFAPAFLGRSIVIPYFPLMDDELKGITRLQVKSLIKRVKANHKAEMTVSDAVYDTIVDRCREVESGARNIQRILSGDLLPRIASALLAKMAEGEEVSSIAVDVADGDFAVTIS